MNRMNKEDFPTQCTLLEILYRLYLIAHSLNNQTLLTLLSQNSPIKVLEMIWFNGSWIPWNKPASLRMEEN